VTQHSRDTPQFYLTAPSPCPYLAGKEERKVFTHLVGERAGELNTPSMRRIMRRNADIAGEMRIAVPTSEQYAIFRGYLDSRHRDGGMADMTVLDYAMMVEDSHIETRIIEYRRKDPDAPPGKRAAGELVAIALTDVLGDGLSMVYSFFEPDEAARSLGTYMVIDHIARAQSMGLAYVYLGYWVRGSRKMDYKSRFLPQERLMPEGWMRVE
jgi:arginine-tRNA-protein transferase